MARKWDDHAGAYKKLSGDVAKFGMKSIKPLVADFINSHRKVERFETAQPALRKSKHEKDYAKLFMDIETAFQSAVEVHCAAVMTIAKLP